MTTFKERLDPIFAGRKPKTPLMSVYAKDPWIIGAVPFGLGLRLVRLDYAPVWFDETFTARHMHSSYLQLVADLLNGPENSLPGYLILLKSWTFIAGTSPWMLRFPSVALSCVAIVLTAALAGTLVSTHASRWAAWLAAISPYLLQHAQEARMYSLLGGGIDVRGINILCLTRTAPK